MHAQDGHPALYDCQSLHWRKLSRACPSFARFTEKNSSARHAESSLFSDFTLVDSAFFSELNPCWVIKCCYGWVISCCSVSLRFLVKKKSVQAKSVSGCHVLRDSAGWVFWGNQCEESFVLDSRFVVLLWFRQQIVYSQTKEFLIQLFSEYVGHNFAKCSKIFDVFELECWHITFSCLGCDGFCWMKPPEGIWVGLVESMFVVTGGSRLIRTNNINLKTFNSGAFQIRCEKNTGDRKLSGWFFF